MLVSFFTNVRYFISKGAVDPRVWAKYPVDEFGASTHGNVPHGLLIHLKAAITIKIEFIIKF